MEKLETSAGLIAPFGFARQFQLNNVCPLTNVSGADQEFWKMGDPMENQLSFHPPPNKKLGSQTIIIC